MLKEKYLDFIAIDADEVEVDTDSTTTETDGQAIDTVETETNEVEDTVDYYDIDGEKYTLDQIREFKKGNMRQSDYTRKTQEISRLRNENKEALEVYQYLSSKPELLEKLIEFDNNGTPQTVKDNLNPALKEVQDLKRQMFSKEIDKQLSEICSKDKLVTDVELLEIANKYRCEIDEAYTFYKGANAEKYSKASREDIKKSLLAELKKNGDATATLIAGADKKNSDGETYGLSDQQLMFAKMYGMTPKEYIKYGSNNTL